MNNKRELSVAQYITNSLFELMKVKPYNDISITEITDKAKVNRVSFYRNFTSKEDIIDKCEFDNNLINLHKKEYSNYKSYFLAGGIFNVYYFWLINGCIETPHQVAEKLVDLMSK